MPRKNFITLVVALLLWMPQSMIFAKSGELTVTQVFKNIFTVSPEGPSGPNSTFVITNEGILVVDTGRSSEDAMKILAEIRRRTMRPIKFVINTHYYGSHTFGNSVFRHEGATIIGHKNVQRALIGKRGERERKRLQKQGSLSLEWESIMPPNLVFEKKMELIFGGYHIQLISQGYALTDGDILVYLPDFKTIIAGGMINNHVVPYMYGSDIEEWIKSLGNIEDYKVEIIIPGFGPVGEKPTAIKMRHYLLDLKQQILPKIEDNKSFQETLEEISPFFKMKYSSWAKQKYSKTNIYEAFKQYQKRKIKNQTENFP